MSIDPRLGEYIRITEFARMVGKTRRTISRWISQPDGLPHLRLGKETHVPLAEAREWLASLVRRPNPRRKARMTAVIDPATRPDRPPRAQGPRFRETAE